MLFHPSYVEWAVEHFFQAVGIILAILYLVLVYEYGSLFLSDDGDDARPIALLLRGTVGVHVTLVLANILLIGRSPFMSVSGALGALALGVALVYVLVEGVMRVQSTGVFVLPLVFVLQMFSSTASPVSTVNPVLATPLFGFHISTAILGYAGTTISAVYGCLYILLYRDLKSGQFGRFYQKLPPLEGLGRMNYHAALIGFVCLTFSIIIGAYWASSVFSGQWIQDPKFIVTVLIWAVMGVIAVSRMGQRWHPRRNAWFALAGFIGMLLSLGIVNLFLTDFHSFTG